jgi:hypothetical protein
MPGGRNFQAVSETYQLTRSALAPTLAFCPRDRRHAPRVPEGLMISKKIKGLIEALDDDIVAEIVLHRLREDRRIFAASKDADHEEGMKAFDWMIAYFE